MKQSFRLEVHPPPRLNGLPGLGASWLRRSAGLVGLILFWAVAIPDSGWCQESRTWTDDTGTYKIEATLKEAKRDSVVLILSDGTTKTVPLARLSEEDRRFAAEARKAMLAENAAKKKAAEEAKKEGLHLKDDLEALLNAFAQRRQELENTESDRNRLRNQVLGFANETATKALELVKDVPSSDMAKGVYVWVLTNVPQGPNQASAAKLMIEHFVDSPEIKFALAAMRPGQDPQTDAVLEQIMTKTSDPSVKGTIMFGMAQVLGMRDAQADEERAVKLLNDLTENYANVNDINNRPLGPQADRLLFAVQHLKVGKVAPDIEGADLDGVAFKLSDYRGKVVVLDFWGDW